MSEGHDATDRMRLTLDNDATAHQQVGRLVESWAKHPQPVSLLGDALRHWLELAADRAMERMHSGTLGAAVVAEFVAHGAGEVDWLQLGRDYADEWGIDEADQERRCQLYLDAIDGKPEGGPGLTLRRVK